MYDDLVKRLREEASSWCINCCYRAGDCICAAPDDRKKDCDICSKLQATGAIEELSRENEILAKSVNEASEILQKRWIPVSERLPAEPYGCLLVVWDSPQNGGDDFLNYLPYFAGWDGEQWNDADGEQVPFEVVYWMPLQPIPKPPKEG